jgi:hypothetical protein
MLAGQPPSPHAERLVHGDGGKTRRPEGYAREVWAIQTHVQRGVHRPFAVPATHSQESTEVGENVVMVHSIV